MFVPSTLETSLRVCLSAWKTDHDDVCGREREREMKRTRRGAEDSD